MTTERQQSLAAARRACEYLRENLFYIQGLPDALLWNFERLTEEFTRLDAKEQKQIAAGAKGAKYGKLGAKHGSKGGRPKKNGGKK